MARKWEYRNNRKMNPVDVADQLRNQYRMDHWLRQKKWWWSIFLWGQGVLLTNAYKVYCCVMDDNNVPNSQRLSHYDFLHEIAVAWIDIDEVNPRALRRIRARKRKKPVPVASPSPTAQANKIRKKSNPSPCTRARSKACLTPPSPPKAIRVNDTTLHPETGVLRHRLDHYGIFHCPDPSSLVKPYCSLHRWLFRDGGGVIPRGKIVSCSHCKVHLCIACFKIFHTEACLVDNKENIIRKLG